MGKTHTLEEIYERTGYAARIEAKGDAKGQEKKALEIAQAMIDLNLPLETIVAATKLDLKKIKALSSSSSNS